MWFAVISGVCKLSSKMKPVDMGMETGLEALEDRQLVPYHLENQVEVLSPPHQSARNTWSGNGAVEDCVIYKTRDWGDKERDRGAKCALRVALARCQNVELAGHNNWRTIIPATTVSLQNTVGKSQVKQAPARWIPAVMDETLSLWESFFNSACETSIQAHHPW